MKFTKPFEEIVKRRRSVRTYTNTPIPNHIRQQIDDYILTLTSPFPAKPSFKFIELKLEPDGSKFGTYGMIKGATSFIGAVVPDTAFAAEAVGYEFEALILYLTTLELGTCWLGGTFTRAEFGKAMGTAEGMLFPAVSPVGYYEKKSFKETLIRGVVRADSRKPWETLFFDGDFRTPLKEEAAGDFVFPLDMLRLAPSASNKQPWRIIKAGSTLHFFEYRTPGYSSAFNFDMQSIDMGIAACHFHLAAIEKGLSGSFVFDQNPSVELPENTIYKFSYVR